MTTSHPEKPAPSKPAPRAPLAPGEVRVHEVLIIAGTALVMVTGAFVLLARMYYKKKLAGELGEIGPIADPMIGGMVWGHVEAAYFWSFATFSWVATSAITVAVLWPREIGHGLAALYAAAIVIAGGKILLTSPMPPLVGILLLGIGGLMGALAWTSWHKRDRAAWAFLLALSGTLTIVMFFGAPRIRATLDEPRLFYVLVMPAVMSAIAVACYRMRRDYLAGPFRAQGTPTTL